ncbi:SHOCT domain-containing protein [Rhodovulum sp. YNF3179]|uniref:SHOCT domain-containing protein n=1 Tax=Rhodovulum sp. YNF3179 TaxID=3425127 RepID=UPI003D338073
MKLLSLTTAAVLTSATATLAGPGDGSVYGGPMWDGGHMWGGGYGFGLFGGLFTLLFWGALIVLAVFAVRWLMDRDNGGSGSGRWGGSAEDILKDRLAKGEIDAEEYRDRMKTLREDQ